MFYICNFIGKYSNQNFTQKIWREIKIITIHWFDFYIKYCILSWLLESILQSDPMNILTLLKKKREKIKEIIEADSLQFEQWPKRIHWRCKKLLYLWYAYASSF